MDNNEIDGNNRKSVTSHNVQRQVENTENEGIESQNRQSQNYKIKSVNNDQESIPNRLKSGSQTVPQKSPEKYEYMPENGVNKYNEKNAISTYDINTKIAELSSRNSVSETVNRAPMPELKSSMKIDRETENLMGIKDDKNRLSFPIFPNENNNDYYDENKFQQIVENEVRLKEKEDEKENEKQKIGEKGYYDFNENRESTNLRSSVNSRKFFSRGRDGKGFFTVSTVLIFLSFLSYSF